MKRSIALSSAVALAVGFWTATPAAANPAVLIFAPAAMGGVSAGWAAAAGLGGVLVGTALGAAAANNGWYGYGGSAYPGYNGYVYPSYSGYAYPGYYANGGYAYYPGYGNGGYAYPGYGNGGYADSGYSNSGYAYHSSYGNGDYAYPGYGGGSYPGYGGYAHPGYYRNGGYTAYAPDRGAVYGQPYAASAPVSHCYRSHRWVNGYSVPVRVCVTPY